MTEQGTFRQYKAINFKPETLRVIDQANKIIDEYQSQGLLITLRQLYYQFVARDLLPNKQENYNRLGRIVSEGRIAGLISWTALEDRNRNLMGLRTYHSPADAFKEARAEYRLDKWANQSWRPEVWVEKAALEGVIGGICNQLQVNFFSSRGYNSQSAAWEAGQRFARYVRKGQRPIVFHFGDHDPSGIDMTNDNRSRLEMFAGVPIQVTRLALNWDQIQKYNPPPNPAKETDSRFAVYAAQHGNESWELDALSPTIIRNLISDAVLAIRDVAAWEEMTEKETDDLRVMDQMIEELGGIAQE